jgi:hypothetical protein
MTAFENGHRRSRQSSPPRAELHVELGEGRVWGNFCPSSAVATTSGFAKTLRRLSRRHRPLAPRSLSPRRPRERPGIKKPRRSGASSAFLPVYQRAIAPAVPTTPGKMGRDRVRTPASSEFKRSHHPGAARRAHKKSPAGTGQGIAFLPFEKANARSHSQGSEKRWTAESRAQSNREVQGIPAGQDHRRRPCRCPRIRQRQVLETTTGAGSFPGRKPAALFSRCATAAIRSPQPQQGRGGKLLPPPHRRSYATATARAAAGFEGQRNDLA